MAADADHRDAEDIAYSLKQLVKRQTTPEVLHHVVDRLRSSGNAAYKAGHYKGLRSTACCDSVVSSLHLIGE
jgi:hypothetical protein